MRLEILSFGNGDPIPGDYAFCVPAEEGYVTMGSNRSPHLRWSDVPGGTMSYAIIMHDPDVPSVADDVNKDDRAVPHDLPRVDYYHWVLVDVSAGVTELPEGIDSDGVTVGGKGPGITDHGLRGINNYTDWFSGDVDMEGTYAGYDGPCPPWNDERLHHYYFTVYALDVERLNLSGNFGGPEALASMQGHILARAIWVGTYTMNPSIRG